MEQKGRALKHEEHKYNRPKEQNEKLDRNLRHGVKQQAEPALTDRFAREISLHLALIAAEIGQREEHAADETAPQVVAIVPVEAEIHGIEPSRSPGNSHGIQKRNISREQGNRDHQ